MRTSAYAVLYSGRIGQNKLAPVTVSDVEVETRFDSERVFPSSWERSNRVSGPIIVEYTLIFVNPFIRARARTNYLPTMSIPKIIDRFFSTINISRIAIRACMTP